MENGWTHIGRLWSNGEPYLVVDAVVRHLWLGFREDEYFDRIVDLGPEETSMLLGEQAAAVVGADGVVRDDSWREVLESGDGTIAIVQAAGDDYRQTLDAAPRYPEAPADLGTVIRFLSREMAIFSAACDGAGKHAMELLPAKVGRGR